MFGLELPEILIIVAVIAVFFGGNKIVGFARSLGRFSGEFRKGQLEVEKEVASIKKELAASEKGKR